MPAIGKKLHHYVPRFYLRAWAEKEKVHCLQDGRILSPNIEKVCSENYFYRLEELSTEDVDFLREAIIRGSPEGLKASHEQLVRAFTLPHLAKRRLKASGAATQEAMAEIERMIIELNENLHTGIEERFQPHLAAMRSGGLDFLEDPKEAATFYHGLAVQYARTNLVRQTRLVLDARQAARYRRIAGPLVHILATNVGRSLFAERKQHKIMLLDNATTIPFITTDQPVINIASGPKDTTPPEKFELYYPVAPRKAMLLLEPASDFLPGDTSVSEIVVHAYNLRIAAHSYRQIFSTSPRVLESIKNERAAYMSCFPEGNTGRNRQSAAE